LIRSGTPIKISFWEKHRGWDAIYAIVKKNEGELLRYVFVAGGEVKERSVHVEELPMHNMTIEIMNK
jgi:hypothetical protein